MKDKIYHQPNLAKSWFLALLCFLALCMQSCRDSDTVISSEPEDTGSKAEKGDVMGLYLLNQGNMNDWSTIKPVNIFFSLFGFYL